MKKALALTLVLVMVLAVLASCGGGGGASKLVGKWEMKDEVSGVSMIWEFGKDGKGKTSPIIDGEINEEYVTDFTYTTKGNELSMVNVQNDAVSGTFKIEGDKLTVSLVNEDGEAQEPMVLTKMK